MTPKNATNSLFHIAAAQEYNGYAPEGTIRKYVRQQIPDELWNAAADLSRRYPPSLVGRVLKRA
jgi:hypothetical protein